MITKVRNRKVYAEKNGFKICITFFFFLLKSMNHAGFSGDGTPFGQRNKKIH